MNLHDLFHVARYEAKQLRREWLFRAFVFISLVGITLCHFFLQGQGHCDNWKMVALPCSMPLVNAYLFCIMQSIFVILLMADFPRRETRGGALDQVHARPLDNGNYTWGRVLGIALLFIAVNVTVMLAAILFVNARSLAPLSIGHYLFYLTTLNLPALVFMMGLSLWLTRVVRWHLLAIVLAFAWLFISMTWLPYTLHGTFDFLGTGVPNLFSEVTGHVGLGYYLLHRLFFLLVGIGLLFHSVKGMNRLPNAPKQAKHYTIGGVALVLVGIACGILLEASYRPVRQAREGYRKSFEAHWTGTPCHVARHTITLRQQGKELDARSELTLCNLNGKTVPEPLLFLNPGLEVVTLEADGQPLAFQRDGQVIAVDRPLASGDSLRLQIHYTGRVDDTFVDLHLSDADRENTFRGDRFFPAGRQGAFVTDDYLLLTPACAWFPTAVPPVHPQLPMYSGKDLTRYQLAVVAPRQRELYSQGIASTRGDTSFFHPSRPLTGISLCGGGFLSNEVDSDTLNISYHVFREPTALVKHFTSAKPGGLQALFEDEYFSPFQRDLADLGWFERESRALHFIETPVSFRVESNPGRFVSGQVEPGIIFLPERAFGIDLMELINIPFVEDKPVIVETMNGPLAIDTYTPLGLEKRHIRSLFLYLESGFYTSPNSHPLLAWKEGSGEQSPSSWCAWSLWSDSPLAIYSTRYPFAGLLFEKLYADKEFIVKGTGQISFSQDPEGIHAYTRKHSLDEALCDPTIPPLVRHDVVQFSVRELVNYLGMQVSIDSFFVALNDIYHAREGMISFEEFSREINNRTGSDIEAIFERWLHVRHDQYFQVIDFNLYSYPDKGSQGPKWAEVEGKVMNRGREGGFVHVKIEENQKTKYYSTYIAPGEAKAFYCAYREDKYVSALELHTGMAANRPNELEATHKEREKPENLQETPGRWTATDTSAFARDPNEIIVDDRDGSFSVDDNPNRSLLQKWFGTPQKTWGIIPSLGEMRLWTTAFDQKFHGDSVRQGYYKSFGTGNCTTTWTTHLPEGGKYRVLAKTGLRLLAHTGQDPDYFTNTVLHYTVRHANNEEKIDVLLDESQSSTYWYDWVVIGEFDFPAGEVSVTLSDKDEKERKDIAIVADAVKWVRIR